jgi:hypothetical protein
MTELILQDGEDSLSKAVLFYGNKYKKDNNYRHNLKCIAGKFSPNREKIKLELSLPIGENVIIYKDVIFKITYINLGTPKDFGSYRGYYSELCLSSKDKNQESFLKEFVKDACVYYSQNILDKKKKLGKVQCYIYDEYWENLNKIPKKNIESLCLPDTVAKDILEDMQTFLSEETETMYNNLGISYKKNYLFEGFPGTGKTSLAYSLASELDYNIAIINFDMKLTDNDFMKAIKKIPDDTILLLEDIDVLFQERKKNDDKSMISFSGLLNSLDGITHREKLITIITTNYKCSLDPALKRPGRIDKQVHFDYATKEQIKSMIIKFFPKKDFFKEFYKSVKHRKFTTAVLQQFLFNNLYSKDILEKIDEFIELCDECSYNENTQQLYT